MTTDLRPYLYATLGNPFLQAFTVLGKTWDVPPGTLCIEYDPCVYTSGGPSWCRMLII